jgi:cellobiose phosphorylase
MYRLITESLLGIQRKMDTLHFAPCVPAGWISFKVDYRFYETTYHINIRHTESSVQKTSISVDGLVQSQPFLVLANDFKDHRAEVLIESPVKPVLASDSVASSRA